MALNAYQDRESPAWQILEHIQRNGPASIRELEDLLGITTNAVRQHLGALQADGYIERQRVHAGVGRPHHAYSITDKARELFACHCDDLALTLLEEVFALEGREQAILLLDRVGSRLAQRYADSVRSAVLQERVEELAHALYRRGVLTGVTVEDENTIILRTYTCPYHELAQEHRDICAMDEHLMRKVLGSEVSLSACMMDGHRGCSFVVSNSAASESLAEAVLPDVAPAPGSS
jgi:predicted ArsR family transcriptional regulator